MTFIKINCLEISIKSMEKRHPFETKLSVISAFVIISHAIHSHINKVTARMALYDYPKTICCSSIDHLSSEGVGTTIVKV